MRTNQQGRGEQCFREGLAGSPTVRHEEAGKLPSDNTEGGLVGIIPSGDGTVGAARVDRRCGFALAAALLHQARVTDPLFLAEAERHAQACLVASESGDGDTGVFRILLALIQETSGQLSLETCASEVT